MPVASVSYALDRFSTFGDLLKYLRRSAGLTQKELSIAVGYSESQISRLEHNERLPDLATITARFLPVLMLEDQLELAEHLLELATSIRREDAPASGLPPYKGLYHFDENDAEIFFGREDLTAALVEKLKTNVESDQRFLAIIGASGSGKSSLVRAGLIPSLRWQQPSSGWPVIIMTPTERPLEAMADVINNQTVPQRSRQEMIKDFTNHAHGLEQVLVKHAQVSGAANFPLVVDQFEELFTLCRDEKEQAAFVNNLLTAALHPGGVAIVIIVLRADFYAHCARYGALRQALSQHQVYIGPMTGAELRRAIEEPAFAGHWELEPGLTDLMLHDIGADRDQAPEPGALPLLSHVLLETWHRRRGRMLTLSGYTASGGVQGAITETAEAVFCDQLESEERDVARQIFLRLTALGDDASTADTRRRVGFEELSFKQTDQQTVQVVLKTLADARLVTLDQDTAEIAHEALIRAWPTLRNWLEEDREGLRMHRHLTESAKEWEASGRDESMFFRGARLAQAAEWAQSNPQQLNAQEQTFLDASLEAAQREQAEREAQRQRELDAARKLAEAERQRAEDQSLSAQRLQRRAWQLAGLLALALILAGAATVFGQQANFNSRLANQNLIAAQTAEQRAISQQATAESERGRAENERQRAEAETLRRAAAEAQAVLERETAQQQARLAFSRELAAAAVSNLQVDPERSLLLAMQALENADTLEARNSLRRALPELHILRTIPAHRQTPGVAYSPDGTLLASIGTESPVKIWDAASGEQQLSLPFDPAGFGMAVDFSPDGTQVAVLTTRQVIVWALPAGQPVLDLSADLSGATIIHASFSPNGKRLAVSTMDGVPRIWDLVTGKQVFVLYGHTKICDAIDFSLDGTLLATGDQAGVVKIWEAATGQELLSFGKGGVIHDLAFSPDGKRLATANEDGTLMIWDPATGRELLSLPRMSGMYGVTFLPDSQRLVTAHQDGTAKMWEATSGQLLLTLAGHVSTVISVSTSPDGAYIATGGYDGMLKIWEAAPGKEVQTLGAHADQVWEIRYTLDGSRLATVSVDGSVKLWDPLTGELLLELNPGSPLTSLAFSLDGKRLAAGGMDGSISVWDSATGQDLMKVNGHQGLVTGVAFSPDGERLVSGSWDATEKVWEISTGKEIVTYTGHTIGFGSGIAISPDGQTVFSGGADGFGRQWDIGTGQEIQKFSAAGREVYGVALSPDGSLLALGLQDGEVDVWDTLKTERILTLSGHAGLVFRLAFSPDGSRLASAAFDGFAKVWDVQTGQELYTLYGNTSNVFGVAFSPDGRRLVTSGGDGTLRIFTMDMNELVALARSRLTRTLTEAECQKYLHQEHCPIEP